jgi:intergrase/recombinase
MALKYQALWNLCLDSGIRLIEGIYVIRKFEPENLQKVNGFYRYKIGSFRGYKQAYYAYFTENTFQLIQSSKREEIFRPNASHYYSKYKVTQPKYLRKFAFDKMIELEVPESVADFIEGRVPKRVGAKHYMVLMRQADKFYGKYENYLTRLRKKMESAIGI